MSTRADAQSVTRVEARSSARRATLRSARLWSALPRTSREVRAACWKRRSRGALTVPAARAAAGGAPVVGVAAQEPRGACGLLEEAVERRAHRAGGAGVLGGALHLS